MVQMIMPALQTKKFFSHLDTILLSRAIHH